MKTTSWIVLIIITLFSVSGVEASYSTVAPKEAPQIIVSADPTMVPPCHYSLSNGDSASVEIEENAILYLLEKDRKNYTLDIYKNDRLLATIYPEDKEALIVFGEYRIEVRDLEGNVVSTVHVSTINAPTWRWLLRLLASILVVILIVYAFLGISRLQKRAAIERFRRQNPAVWRAL